MNMSLSGLCTSFGKVTLFSLPEVSSGPQICQKCVNGRGSAPDPAGGAHDAPPDPQSAREGDTPSRFPDPLSTHNSIRKYFLGNLVTAAPLPIHLQYASACRVLKICKQTLNSESGPTSHRRNVCLRRKNSTHIVMNHYQVIQFELRNSQYTM